MHVIQQNQQNFTENEMFEISTNQPTTPPISPSEFQSTQVEGSSRMYNSNGGVAVVEAAGNAADVAEPDAMEAEVESIAPRCVRGSSGKEPAAAATQQLAIFAGVPDAARRRRGTHKLGLMLLLSRKTW